MEAFWSTTQVKRLFCTIIIHFIVSFLLCAEEETLVLTSEKTQ